jgi:hypothetical protein
MSENKEYTLGDYNDGVTLYDFVREQLKDVDTADLSDDVSKDPEVEITPEKVYFWTRIYMKEENPNIEIGDTITMRYVPSGEEMKTQFFAYGKTGLDRDHDDELISFDAEEDKKVLCLMVEEKIVNESEDIPFIRTLFKLGRHYEYNVMKRGELIFVNDRNGIVIDWFDCDF